MVFPSGLISTDVQVPSVVLRLMVRLGFRGKSLYLVNTNESLGVVSGEGGTGIACPHAVTASPLPNAAASSFLILKI
jgi:hypothetical protein